MAEDTPDLDLELDKLISERKQGQGCRYGRTVPDDLKAAIRKKYEAGLFVWSAFSELCKAHGVDINPDIINNHFRREHSDDR